ncbi:DUF1272 domain-containing protein [Methylobacterium sp. C25]|uniref:DUF1272 domain-containing protein n=1 Tax=Methylobacterium sp. C25 TaxID=2721622 RepID=UPI001F2BBDD4|nr:DUF1272 domain-containing protein [Methylobacterium sp. C25]MCE4226610.1 DUF1272 domain-containing protein [Methylobacterium sp. C25]
MARLDLRPNCECCDKDLPPDSREAFICTFECTFCRDCVEGVLDGHCPNCLGNLVERPIRPIGGPVGGLSKYPASTKRVLKNGGCVMTPDPAGADAVPAPA